MILPMMLPERPGELFARRLRRLGLLSTADASVLSGLEDVRHLHPAGEVLEEQGAVPRKVRLVCSGWAGLARTLPDGRRQIFRLLLPGDLLGTSQAPAPCSLVALTLMESSVLNSTLGVMRAAPERFGDLPGVISRLRTLEETWLLNHIMRLGRQTALERTAHLLLELRDRLMAVDMAEEQRFALPLTQEMMADVLGLSTVHMNRTLQELRRQRLLRLERGGVELMDPARLALIADYNSVPPPVNA